MNCAIEILAIDTVAKVEKEAKMIAAKEKRREATINFCETVINDALVEKAKRGLAYLGVRIEFGYITDLDGYRAISPLVRDKYTYANGKESYRVKGAVSLDLDIMKEYLENHCYKMTSNTMYYNTYGYGQSTGIYINVSPDGSKLHCIK
jgi:hypothetical protein